MAGKGKRRMTTTKKPTYKELKELRQPDPSDTAKFNVEKIQRKWVSKDGNDVQYYVKWLGWPKSHNTWEKADSFKDCPDVLTEFEAAWEAQQSKKKKPSNAARSSSLKSTLSKGESTASATSKMAATVTATQSSLSNLPEKVVCEAHSTTTDVDLDRFDDDSYIDPGRTADNVPKFLNAFKKSPEPQVIHLLHPDLVTKRRHMTPIFVGVTKIKDVIHYLARFEGETQLVCFCSEIANTHFDSELLEYLQAVSEYKKGHQSEEFKHDVPYSMVYRDLD